MNRIGKYEIQGEIGQGGFGKVYRGYDHQVRRPVAIKVLTGDNADQSAVSRFRVEATAAGNLLHKNIVTVYEFAQDAGIQFLVMEYLEGEDLQRILMSARSLSLLEKVTIMHEVADGLQCAHRHGVIHRDVKPANIMLLSTGGVKIMDFGIARLIGKDATRMTKTGYIMGSMLYMSPEQYQSGSVDALCDIWSYGVVLYELLSGTSPFQASDPPSVMFKIASHVPPPISAVVNGCPKELDAILLKLLSKDRDARYQSFEDVQFDLDPVLLSLQKQEATELFRKAKHSGASNDLETANALIEQSLALDRFNAEARQFKEKLRDQLRAFRQIQPKVEALLGKSEEAFARGDYSEASKLAQAGLDLDPASRRALACLSQSREAKARHEKTAQLLDEADQCLRNSELTSAFEKASEAQRTEPASTQAADLLASIQRTIEARDRSLKIRDALGRVRGLIVTGGLDDAIRMLNELRLVYPESPEVSALLDRTVAERAAQECKQRLAARTAEIRELLRAGRWVAAIAELEELKRGSREEPEIESMLSYARDALEEQRRKEALEKTCRDAWALSRAKKFDEALVLLSHALREYPADERLVRLIQNVESAKTAVEEEREVAQGMNRCEKLRESGNLAEAAGIVDRLAEKYPRNERVVSAQSKLKKHIEDDESRRRAESFDRQVGKAREALDRGQPAQAVQLFEEISRLNPGRAEIAPQLEAARRARQEKESRIEIDAALKTMTAREAAGDLRAARETIASLLLRHPDSDDLRRAVGRLDAAVMEGQRRKALAVIAQAVEDGMGREDWPLCFAQLSEADRQYPGEAALWDLRSRVNRQQRENEELRRKDALGALLQEIDDGVGRRDWQFCGTRIARAEEQFPGEPGLQALRAKVQHEQQRDEEERRRREALVELSAGIEAGMNRRDWIACQERFAQADKQFPSDPAMQALRERVKREELKDDEQQRHQALGLIEAGIEQAIQRRDWESCNGCLNDADKRYPGEPLLHRLRTRVSSERQQEEAELRRRQSLAAAVSAIEKGVRLRDWQFSLARLTEAEQQFSEQPSLRRLRTQIVFEQQKDEGECLRQEALGVFVKEIEDGIVRRDWPFCLAKLEGAETKFPGEPWFHSLRGRVASGQKQDDEDRRLSGIADLNTAIEEGRRRRDWGHCEKRLDEADKRYPGEPAFRTLRSKVNLERLRQEDDQRLRDLADISKAVEHGIRNKDWMACVSKLDEADKQYPADPSLRSLRSKFNTEQQRVEEDRRLSALVAINKAVEEGVLRRDWPFCRERLNDAERQFPGDSSLLALRTRVEGEYEREESAQRRAAFDAVRNAIGEAIHLKDWQSCWSRLSDADKRFPGEPALRDLRAVVKQNQERDEADRRLREIDDLCARVSDNIVREEWARGSELIQAGLKQVPNHAVLLKLQEQLKTASARRRAVSEAEAHLSKQRFHDAEPVIRALLKNQPNDPEARALMASVEQHKERQRDNEKRAMGRDQVERLLHDREYEKAIKRAVSLLEAFPGDSGFEESLRSAMAAKELQNRRIKLGETIAKLEQLFQKGKAAEVRTEAAAVLAIQEEPRARELFEWAEAAIKRHRLPPRAAFEIGNVDARRKGAKWAFTGLVVALAVILGLAVMFYSRRADLKIGKIVPESFSFVQSSPSAPGPQSLTVAGGSADLIISVSDNWIQVLPQRGESPATFMVAVNAEHLKEGHHSGYVTIIGPNQTSKTVPVVLSLDRGPAPKSAPPVTPPVAKAPIRHEQPPIKAQPKKTEPVVVTQPAPPPPSPSCPPNGSDLEVTPPPVYTGRLSGTGFWTGSLPANCTVTLAGARAGFGTLTRYLPAKDATVSVGTAGVQIVETGVGRVLLRNISAETITRIDFTWQINSH